MLNCDKWFATNSNNVFETVEKIVGDDGYVDWDTEMDYASDASFENVGLVDSDTNSKYLWIRYNI